MQGVECVKTAAIESKYVMLLMVLFILVRPSGDTGKVAAAWGGRGRRGCILGVE